MDNSARMDNSDQPADEREDRLGLFLASFHEALLQGKPTDEPLRGTTGIDISADPELERAKRVLVGLARARVLTPTLGDTIAPDLPALSWAEFSRATAHGKEGPVLQRLGRFQIERELGRGGLGVVFLARDPVLQRRVALKVPRPEALLTQEARLRFTREAQAAARLTHPNLVAVHEVGQAGPVTYIVSALCEGPNLATWLAGHKAPPSPRLAARLVERLAEAVHYAHSLGILHRDIKPSNILLEPTMRGSTGGREDNELGFIPKLADFGLARVEDLGGQETQTGAVLGTPGYMSPEQAEGRGSSIGAATDVYGLGTVLYELLVGRGPFAEDSGGNVLYRVIHEEPKRPRELVPNVPRDLEAICLKCLEKDPGARYRSAADLATDLGRYLAGEATLARPIGPLGRAARWVQRQPWIAGLGALVFSLLFVVAAVSTFAAIRIARERDLAEQAEQASKDALAKRQAALEAEAKALEEARVSAAEASRQAQVATGEAARAKREADTANRLSDLMLGLFQSIDPTGLAGLGLRGDADLGRDLTSRELLERVVAAVTSKSFANEEPIVRARLLARVSKTCRLAGLPDEANQLSQDALEALGAAGDAATEADRALVKQVAGFSLDDTEDLDDKVRLLRESLAHAEAVTPRSEQVELVVASIQFDLAWVLTQSIGFDPEPERNYVETERLLRESLATRRKRLGDGHPDVAATAMGVSLLLLTMGDDEKLQKFAVQEFMPIMAAQPGGDHFMHAARLFLGGMAARREYDLDGAIAKYEKGIALVERLNDATEGSNLISASHPMMLLVWGELAGTYKQNGQYREAEAAIQKLIAISDRALPNGHPKLVAVLVEYAQELADRRDYDLSNAMAHRALAIAMRNRKTFASQLQSPIHRLVGNAIASADDSSFEASINECFVLIAEGYAHERTAAGPCLAGIMQSLKGFHAKERGTMVAERITDLAGQWGIRSSPLFVVRADLWAERGDFKMAQWCLDRVVEYEVPTANDRIPVGALRVLGQVLDKEIKIHHFDLATAHAHRILQNSEKDWSIGAGACQALATIALMNGEPSVATEHHREAIRVFEQEITEERPDKAGLYLGLAYALFAASDFAASLASVDMAISVVSSSQLPLVFTAEAIALLAVLKPRLPAENGKIDSLSARLREAIAQVVASVKEKNQVEDSLFFVGLLSGRLADSKPEFARYLTPEEKTIWDGSIAESAIGLLEGAIALSDAKGTSFPTWRIRQELDIELGRWLMRVERWQEAETHLMAAYQRCSAALDPRHILVTVVAEDLARLYTAQGRAAEAEKFERLSQPAAPSR